MVTIHQIRQVFAGKRVFLTGHTGFKGSWLLQILAYCGAEVTGYALPPEKAQDLYNQIDGDSLCVKSHFKDIRNIDQLQTAFEDAKPDFVFHLAAQPLVLKSYQDPLYTFEVNTMGTAHVLEVLKKYSQPCVAVMVTTDKVYENNDTGKNFSENDPLGGFDPYSASKAACELIISSYRHSFFHHSKMATHGKSIVSVRAGNVIGGGDYADNRIIPDIIRSLENNEEIVLRNPKSTRPWQHVLEPLAIYLDLAMHMFKEPDQWNEAFNIGPDKSDVWTVEDLAKEAISVAGKGRLRIEQNPDAPHEAALLMLDNQKIKDKLHWKPRMNAREAIGASIQWYLDEEDASARCLKQIKSFFDDEIQDAEHD